MSDDAAMLDYLDHEWTDLGVGFVGCGRSSTGMRAAASVKPALARLHRVPVDSAVDA
jgi:hypothetical protein